MKLIITLMYIASKCPSSTQADPLGVAKGES